MSEERRRLDAPWGKTAQRAPADDDEQARQVFAAQLARVLRDIEMADQDYTRRYGLVLRAMFTAHYAGFPAGVKIDPAEPDWPVFYIELPTGQVSWHMPQHGPEWDGHSTEEKYARINAFASGMGV